MTSRDERVRDYYSSCRAGDLERVRWLTAVVGVNDLDKETDMTGLMLSSMMVIDSFLINYVVLLFHHSGSPDHCGAPSKYSRGGREPDEQIWLHCPDVGQPPQQDGSGREDCQEGGY